MPKDILADPALVAALRRQLAACRTERDEALAQQAASAEILQVINRSPGDLGSVFDAILERATRIGEAKFGIIYRFDGDVFRVEAVRDATPAYIDYLRQEPPRPDPKNALGRLLQAKRPIHIADIKAEPAYAEREPARVATVEIAGARTYLAVPMLKEDRLIGAIAIYRQEVRPFSDIQIEMARTFADQAVIAIETVRLFNELNARTRDLQELLEYQTATSDVLKVISRSAFDVQPVLDTLVETAGRLCNGNGGGLAIRDGEAFRYVAWHGETEEFRNFLRQRTFAPGRDTGTARVLLDGKVVHIPDVTADPEYVMSEMVTLGNWRTYLGVPLLREGTVVGVITLNRRRAEPFTERQIELVRTFADQAVIALENARLLRELRESLEQQTATTEVLQVINASPGDLKPVFDAILEKAHHLCGATNGLLVTKEGEHFRTVATRAATEGDVELLQRPFQAMPNSPYALLSAGERVVHIPDLVADTRWDQNDPRRASAIEHGLRTMLFIPLRKDNTLLGYISANRHEMRPFSAKQIKLLEGFAAQAVIAMENARLLGELRQSLEYQTATSDVLKVISRSTFDLQPILDALVATAVRLCHADLASINIRDGEVYRVVASFEYSPELSAYAQNFPMPPGRGTLTGRTALERQVVHVADLVADPEYNAPGWVTFGKARTGLGVPLLRDGEPIGVIVLLRQRVEPFTERQIELVRTFADQVVIAIENARLVGELRESLEQQTATSEVLQVINASPGELKPVFEAILDKALRLSHSAFGTMRIFDGTRFHLAAEKNVPQAYMDFTANRIADRLGVHALGPIVARVLTEKRVLQIVDTKDDDLYRKGDPMRRAVVDLAGARTILFVPLINDDIACGTIMVFRTEVRPFSDKEIALLQNFGAQAVIAMDNARLLGELRERQAELRVTFDNMGDGVALFDAGQRLVAWNRNFQQILDLPDALLEHSLTYAEYIRMLADRGEFGSVNIDEELDRRLRDLDRKARFSRTRPNGRVIEAHRNPVPGGGFVLIYSDVTERKRAEAEISAARDAAERALGELTAAQANLIQAEKMASLGQLTAGIAHEIKNPLNFVNNFASLSNELLTELKDIAAPALKALDDDRRAELDEVVGMLAGNLGKIVEHGRRADGIVKSMLAHSRGGSGDRQAVDLNALIEESLNLAYHGARAQDQNFNITLERELDPAIKSIELVPQDITRVFLNLFGNGFYAANKRARACADGSFRPVLRVETHDAGDAVEIRVRDNGVGIPAEIREKLFQPFFTTKPTGEGTGLGLSISYDIVTQQHGGAIAVDSEEGVFTEFTVRLPRGGRALQAKGLS